MICLFRLRLCIPPPLQWPTRAVSVEVPAVGGVSLGASLQMSYDVLLLEIIQKKSLESSGSLQGCHRDVKVVLNKIDVNREGRWRILLTLKANGDHVSCLGLWYSSSWRQETAIEKILDANAYLLSKSWMLGDFVVSLHYLACHILSLFFSSPYQSAYQSFHCFSLSFSWGIPIPS